MSNTLRIARLSLLALALPGCNEKSPGPLLFGSSDDQLTGNYQAIYWTFDTSRGAFQSSTAALSFDGKGSYSSDWTGPQMINRTGSMTLGWTAAGTYQVDDDRSVTLNSVYGGGLSGDKLFINAATFVGGSFPSLAVAIRRQSGNFYHSDLVGDFHLLSISHIIADGTRQSVAGLVTFSGGGSWSGAADFNDEGAVTAAQRIDGTYSENNDGNLQFNGMIGTEEAEGAFRDLGMTAVATSSNSGNDPRIYILIKEAGGLSDADLDGEYFFGGFIAGGTNVARQGTIIFDAEGGFTSTFLSNDEGDVTMGNDSGSYSVDSNGRVTLVVSGGGPSYTGAVRGDGAFGAVAGVTEGESPALLTFTRK